jgi:hypothetical protein
MWHLGEERYAYTRVTSSTGVAFTISDATYSIYDEDDVVVASGSATIDGATIYALWKPSEIGVYTVHFLYEIGTETFSSKQVIEVKDTL